MRRTYHRRRRHYSNWIYVIISICFLLVTLCIISLIPGSSEVPGTELSPSQSGLENEATHAPTSSPSNGILPGQTLPGLSPSDSYIAITLNQDKLSAVTENLKSETLPSLSQSSEQLRTKLQEIALQRELLATERIEFQTLYDKTNANLSTEQNEYTEKQKQLEAEADKLRPELEKTNQSLVSYKEQQTTLEQEHKTLSEEETQIKQTEEELSRLSEDIEHAREQLTLERRELESGIQGIRDNPHLSDEGKETALLPLYAALEQLLIRESQLEQSESEYAERSEALLTQTENYESRLQAYETDRDKLDKEFAPLLKQQEEQDASIKALEAQLTTIDAELKRIKAESETFLEEYRTKLQTLTNEDDRLAREERNLKKQAASLQTGNSPENIATILTPERIVIHLQNVLLYENSDSKTSICLKDIADIRVINPNSSGRSKNISTVPLDSSEANSSGSHKDNN